MVTADLGWHRKNQARWFPKMVFRASTTAPLDINGNLVCIQRLGRLEGSHRANRAALNINLDKLTLSCESGLLIVALNSDILLSFAGMVERWRKVACRFGLVLR
jgi:hypothetical protein